MLWVSTDRRASYTIILTRCRVHPCPKAFLGLLVVDTSPVPCLDQGKGTPCLG